MKVLLLPKKIFLFWYPYSLIVFIRSWRNILTLLEEDLAVGLMVKLLFVPLFHDVSFLGKILSFVFRSFRIIIGIWAFTVASVVILALAIYWFFLPILVIVGFYFNQSIYLFSLHFIVLFSGVVLFTYHTLIHPAKKAWQIKNYKEIWQCSFVKSRDTSLSALLQTYEVAALLSYLERKTEDFLNIPQQVSEDEVLKNVWELGKKLQPLYLYPDYFFVGKLLSLPNLDNFLAKLDLKREDMLGALEFVQNKRQKWRLVLVWDEDFKVLHLKGTNRGWLGIPTPTLDLVSEDLTQKASKVSLPDFVGRAHIVSQVVNILSQERGRNVLLIGEPGSGRSALVEYLAKLIIAGDAPETLATKRLVKLNIASLLVGITNQGDLATKIKSIFEEVCLHHGIIVFIDEIQNLGIGEAGTQYNLFSLLLPYIESADFQFIATATPESFSKIIQKNSAFARLFTKIELTPATEAETVDILKHQAILHEKDKKIKTSFLAIKDIVSLTSQYIHDRVLPDSALQIYQECLVASVNGWITKKVVDGVFSQHTNVPVEQIDNSRKLELLNLENLIHRKMVGQEEAVSAVANTLRRAATKLREKDRPIGSFLFIGPTGVGKTELAKILVECYFQGLGYFLRLDMSEYQTEESVNSLIGQPSEEGILTETIRNKPYSLILLDEFEKANPKILTLFLQVLDDGRLTSGSGKVVDFTNTIIIATSNVGSLTLAEGLKEGQSLEVLKPKVNEALLQTFKPELVNRFDEIVLFKGLSPLDLIKIVRIKLAGLQKLLEDQGLMVQFSDKLVEKLAKVGFDPVLGARPLRRLIQDTVETRLSRLILEEKLPKGEKFIVGEEMLS